MESHEGNILLRHFIPHEIYENRPHRKKKNAGRFSNVNGSCKPSGKDQPKHEICTS